MSENFTEEELQAFNDEIDALDNTSETYDDNAIIIDYYIMETILTECDLIHALYGNLILSSDCPVLLPLVFKKLNGINCFNKSQLQNLLIGVQESVVDGIGLYWQPSID